MNVHQKLLELRKKEKQLTKDILDALQVMENSRAYLKMGYSSLYDYLVRGLGYSESAAYKRQSCVRLIKELPEVKQKIDSGHLNPTGISMAFKTLRKKTKEEKREILRKIESQPTREIKRIIENETVGPSIKIQKTEYKEKVVLRLEFSKEQNRNLEKLKALTSHQGDLSQLIEKLINKSLSEYESKLSKPQRSQNPRYISKGLRNEVLKEAEYRCQFKGCEETRFLQIDHIVPVRAGGKAHRNNLQVLCSAHNQLKG